MIYGDNEDDINGQYVIFTKVYDEQRKLYGRTRKAILSLVGICKKMNGSILDVIETAMKDYGYSEQKAREMVQKYWKQVESF